jgi:hypothetical protein
MHGTSVKIMFFCILTDGRANFVPFHTTVYKDGNTYVKLEANRTIKSVRCRPNGRLPGNGMGD